MIALHHLAIIFHVSGQVISSFEYFGVMIAFKLWYILCINLNFWKTGCGGRVASHIM